jgi:DNA-binding beta-propeller fold protein YncE
MNQMPRLMGFAAVLVGLALASPGWAQAAASSGPDASASTLPTISTLATFTFPPGTNPESVVVDSAHHWAYVGTSHGVIAVNTVAGTATRVAGRGPADDVAVDQKTGLAYVPQGGRGSGLSSRLAVLRGSTVVAHIRLAHISEPSSVIVDPSTHVVYVTDSASSALTVIKRTTLVKTLHLAKLSSTGAINAATNLFYLPNPSKDKVLLIRGDKVIATVPVGSRASSVAVDQGRDLAYVTDTGSSSVSVISGSRHFVVHTVKVPENPTGIAVNPATHLAYLGHSDQVTSMTVLNGAHVDANIAVAGWVHGIGIDPVNGLVLSGDEISNVDVFSGDTLLGTVAGEPDGTLGAGFDTGNGRAVVTVDDGETVLLLQTPAGPTG